MARGDAVVVFVVVGKDNFDLMNFHELLLHDQADDLLCEMLTSDIEGGVGKEACASMADGTW